MVWLLMALLIFIVFEAGYFAGLYEGQDRAAFWKHHFAEPSDLIQRVLIFQYKKLKEICHEQWQR